MRRSRRNRSRPSDQLNDKELLREAALQNLYQAQHNYWKNRLYELAKRNLDFQPSARANCDDPTKVGIYWNNRSWYWFSRMSITDDKNSCTILPVVPQLEEEARLVTAHLEELQNEVHLARRFLSGLLIFEVPAIAIKRALGLDLIEEIERDQKVSFDALQDSAGHTQNQIDQFTDYVNENKDIIDMLHNRILTNLILSQQINGK